MAEMLLSHFNEMKTHLAGVRTLLFLTSQLLLPTPSDLLLPNESTNLSLLRYVLT